jgi:hypothetical protein
MLVIKVNVPVALGFDPANSATGAKDITAEAKNKRLFFITIISP